ncbi:caspase family protein [Flavobacteriaceae bacterium]|nr:caspase family protein [Flavobacteriaceae bacterium]
MFRLLLVLFLFTNLLTSQVIPPGYKLEFEMDIDETIYRKYVYVTNDLKFLVVKTGYKPESFSVFSLDNYKLINKVRIDKYISNLHYKNGMFVALSKRNKHTYTFNAFKTSEYGALRKIKKSDKLLEGFDLGYYGETKLEFGYPPIIKEDRLIVWDIGSFQSRDTPIKVYKQLKKEVVNNTPIINPVEIETDVQGQYYALIVGINDYKDDGIMDLDNPIIDANNFSKVLIENYTYNKENVKIILNATKDEFLQELDNFSNLLSKNDNFTIFYAGHGYWDEKFNEGYWFLSDSYKNKRRTWVSNGQVQEYLRGISSKSTLLIADACFSGSIFKTRTSEINKISSIKKLYEIPSRKAMTSGNFSTVADKSVFMKYLIKRLQENSNKYLTSEQLFSSIKTTVINNSINNQIPQYGIINGVGDEGGDFIFIKK